MKFDTRDKIVWQVGSGDASRPYEDICLEFGIATVSPGNAGPAGSLEANEYYRKTGLRDWGSVLASVKKGDLVVLRKGMKQIVAVGEAVSS